VPVKVSNHHPTPLERSKGFCALSRAIVDEEMIVPIPAGKQRQQRRNSFVGTVRGLVPVASARAVQNKAEGGGVQPPGAQ